jgi:hypothetical protein
MILRSFLRLAARASLVALATASVAVGCSRQGEGERCDLLAAGNDDCDSGLVCVSCEDLADHVTDRCCPASGSSDPRCQKGSPGECLTRTGTGGSGGSAGAAGMSAGGASAGGSSGAASGGTAGEDDPAGAGGA